MKEDNKALDIALSAKNRRDAMKAQHQDLETEGRTKTVSQICSYLEKSQMRGVGRIGIAVITDKVILDGLALHCQHSIFLLVLLRTISYRSPSRC
jgi:hypothetical protein